MTGKKNLTSQAVSKKKSQKTKSNTYLKISLILVTFFMLLACCCGVSVLCGFLGYLPASIQEEYDSRKWFCDDCADDDLDQKYPDGKVSTWWWSADESEKKEYIQKNGYPYELYSFDWESKTFVDDVLGTLDNCSTPSGDIENWWSTTSDDTRTCFILKNGLPPFLYGYNWKESDWNKDNKCTHPNGEIEIWWFDVSDKIRDCYTWQYGLPMDIYQHDFVIPESKSYDESNSTSNLSCVYNLDCDLPNGDVDLWFDKVSESIQACFVYDYAGTDPFWADEGCGYPNGDIDN